MSSVAAVLLMYLGEEETFWALHTLMIERKFAMHGLYIVGFPKLMRFLSHHDKILTKLLPKLKKHFDKHNLDAVLYSLKWFFVIFVERVSNASAIGYLTPLTHVPVLRRFRSAFVCEFGTFTCWRASES